MEIMSKFDLEDLIQLKETNLRLETVCYDDYMIGKLRKVSWKKYLQLLEVYQDQENQRFLRQISTIKCLDITTFDQLIRFHMSVDNPESLNHKLNKFFMQKVKCQYFINIENLSQGGWLGVDLDNLQNTFLEILAGTKRIALQVSW